MRSEVRGCDGADAPARIAEWLHVREMQSPGIRTVQVVVHASLRLHHASVRVPDLVCPGDVVRVREMVVKNDRFGDAWPRVALPIFRHANPQIDRAAVLCDPELPA